MSHGQVQTCAAGFDGEDEGCLNLTVGRLRALDHPVALEFWHLAVNSYYLRAERLFKMSAKDSALSANCTSRIDESTVPAGDTAGRAPPPSALGHRSRPCVAGAASGPLRWAEPRRDRRARGDYRG